MDQRGIRLQYSFEQPTQRGSSLENPLFDLLTSLRDQGSISHVAKSLGQSYRHVWGSLRHWESVLGQPLVQWAQGKRAQLTPFAQRLVWAETQARSRMAPHIEGLRQELQYVLEQALDGNWQVLEIFASHDQALPLLQSLAGQQHKVHLSLRFAGSLDALKALAEGRCTVAGFHVPDFPQGSNVFAHALKPLLKPGLHKLMGSHRRTQGWMMRPEGPGIDTSGAGWGPLLSGACRLVNRQSGSGTRLLMEHLLEQAGLKAADIPGFERQVEQTHLAVAAAIAADQGDVGLGTQAAAQAFGLRFVPVVEERYHLVCLKSALDTPAVLALRELLQQPAWAQALSSLAGFSAAQAGEVLSLTRALPWWQFRRARR